MAILAGGWNGRFRVGIDLSQSPSNPTPYTKSITITVKFYVQTSYDYVNDSQILRLSGPGTGGDAVNFEMNTEHSWRLVATRRYTRTLYYSSGYVAEYGASLSSVFNGANPWVQRTTIIPRRPVGTPSRPGTPRVSALGSTSAEIRWASPSAWYGADLFHYRVEADNNSGFTSLVFSDISENNVHTITGLQPGTRYYARVRAGTSGGTTANSYSVSFVTKAQPPDPPTGLHEDGVTATAVALDWTASSRNGAATTSYTVQYARNSSFSGAVSTTTTTNAKRLSNLSRRTQYWWRVRANSGAGSSGWSATNSFITDYALPTAPTNLHSTDQTHDSVTLEWNLPSDNGGDPLNGHTVQRSTNSAFTVNVVSTNADADNTALLTGLASNTTYYWRVRADNVVGNGPWSGVIAQATSSGVPSVPTSILTGDITYESATTTFNPPSSDGGQEITGYQGQLSTTSDFAVITHDTGEEVEPPFEWTGLNRNLKYYMRLRAFNGNGSGAWSTTRSFTTLTGPPGAPGTPVASGVTPNQYTVSATPPVDDGDMPIVGYQWQFTTYDPAVMWSDPEGVDLVDQTVLAPVTRLFREPAQQYLVRVAAINANGLGEFSGDLIVTTLAGYSAKLRITMPLARSSAPAAQAALVTSVVARGVSSSPVVATPAKLTLPLPLSATAYPTTSSQCNAGLSVGLVGHAVPVHGIGANVGLKGVVGLRGSLPVTTYLSDATVPDLDTTKPFSIDIVGTVRYQFYGDPLEHPTLDEISENLTLEPIGEWD